MTRHDWLQALRLIPHAVLFLLTSLVFVTWWLAAAADSVPS